MSDTSLRLRGSITLLIICNFLAVVLLATNLTGLYETVWQDIDTRVFRALNGTIGPDSALTHFWGWTNSKTFDRATFVVMMGFCVYLVMSTERPNRIAATAKIIAIGLLIAIAVGLSKKVLDGFFHPSPGYLLTDYQNVNDFITGYTVKTTTDHSFPGDHAMTSALFAGGVILLFRGRIYAMAFSILLMIFVCLPRMAGGGHWFTDVIVGGGATCLILLPWLVVSPYVAWVESVLIWGWSKVPALIRK